MIIITLQFLGGKHHVQYKVYNYTHSGMAFSVGNFYFHKKRSKKIRKKHGQKILFGSPVKNRSLDRYNMRAFLFLFDYTYDNISERYGRMVDLSLFRAVLYCWNFNGTLLYKMGTENRE
jgi:hypothetical protein